MAEEKKMYTVKEALEIMDQIMASNEAVAEHAANAARNAANLAKSARFAFKRFKRLRKYE